MHATNLFMAPILMFMSILFFICRDRDNEGGWSHWHINAIDKHDDEGRPVAACMRWRCRARSYSGRNGVSDFMRRSLAISCLWNYLFCIPVYHLQIFVPSRTSNKIVFLCIYFTSSWTLFCIFKSLNFIYNSLALILKTSYLVEC